MIDDQVTLRPVVVDDLQLFELEFSDEAGTSAFQWFGFTHLDGRRRRLEADGLLGPDGGMLTVVAGAQPAGFVEWFRSAWGRPDTSWCWMIAIGLLPAVRRRGIGTEAQRQLVAYLFDHTRAERIQAFTDRENEAEVRALEKAGFEREGVVRSAQWRQGAWHDVVLYATVRSPG